MDGVQSWSHVLFMDSVQSWSHILFMDSVQSCVMFFFMDSVQSCVTGTRIARGGGDFYMWYIFSLVPQEIILVTAPELQEDLLGTEMKKVALTPVIYSYHSRLNLVPQDILVTAPELQEDVIRYNYW